MTKKQIVRAAVLNGSIVIVDVLLLSKGFFNLLSRDNIILSAIGISVIVMSVLFFFYGNYTILLKQPTTKLYKASELQDYDDYIGALNDCPNQKIFKNKIDQAIKQTERMRKKSEILEVILLQYFEEGEMSYARFKNVIDATRTIFFENIKKVINAVVIYDGEGYKGKHETKEDESCLYMERVEKAVNQNVILLKKLDELTFEISKLDDMRETSLDEIPAVQEIDQLIKETKYYQ